MTLHLVALAGETDALRVEAPTDDVCPVAFDRPGDPRSIGDSTGEVLADNGLRPSPIAADLLRLAVSVYTADAYFPRRAAFDRWTRDLRLYLPVSNPEIWASTQERLDALLAYLTGDHWRVDLRPLPERYEPFVPYARAESELAVDSVCLFSGGLDSFIGAVDALEADTRLALVGHHAKGTGATSASQNDAIAALRSAYGEDRTPFLRFWIAPHKGPDALSETSSRGRSLLFLALGLAVASAAGARTLIVPENGFISLNVPLTNSRLGSLSTRTTHPYFINLVRELVSNLGLPVDLRLPYRFATKGEMAAQCANREVLARSVSATMSCSHPESNRFRARDPKAHCGRCVPCLIRRAALVGISDQTKYVHEDLSVTPTGRSGSDLRALRLALARFRNAPPTIADVLTAGPLPGTDQERASYVDVFRRGLTEVRTFLRRYDNSA